MELTKTVIATFELVGFHRWNSAPEAVLYLAVPHRHRFRVRVECAVTDSDREVEFHMLAREASRVLRGHYPKNEHGELIFDGCGCEHIAEALLTKMREAHHGYPVTAVEVWEDGEHGARVEHAP